MTFKEKVYHAYITIVNNKITSLQKNLTDLQESSANETKRTAGDKHETALAMLQIEQENTTRQLNEAIQQKKIMTQIDPAIYPITICKGSLVKTNRGFFFISAALGKTEIEGITVFAVSPASPIGIQMMGLKKGDQFSMNRTDYDIESIE
jgi:peptidyl-tRNA hydrolase